MSRGGGPKIELYGARTNFVPPQIPESPKQQMPQNAQISFRVLKNGNDIIILDNPELVTMFEVLLYF